MAAFFCGVTGQGMCHRLRFSGHLCGVMIHNFLLICTLTKYTYCKIFYQLCTYITILVAA